ncbi:MAG: diphthine--ammonia ligase [Candidatus Micrarchaeota archaeon]
MKCAALVSGGKDGWLSVWYAQSSGLSVEAIVTFIPKKLDSFMFHGINSKLVKEQARLAGMKHIEFLTSGEKEKEQKELEAAFSKLRKLGFEAVITGAIESEYQRERIERAGVESGLVHFSPLWHKNQTQLLEEILESGHDAIIVAVAADGMGKEWLGKRISECKGGLLRLNKANLISPIGEGGEFETFATESPLFKKKIEIKKAKVIWEGSSGFLVMERYVFSP